MGRAARHVDGHCIMYADIITDSMRRAIDETYRRRDIQEAHNREHGITPQGISKAIRDITDRVKAMAESRVTHTTHRDLPKDELIRVVKDLETHMHKAAKNLEFEKAALLRDEIVELRKIMVIEKSALSPVSVHKRSYGKE